MNDDSTLSQLEELAERLGMKIRYEPLHIEGAIHAGGFCRYKDQDFVATFTSQMKMKMIHVLTGSLVVSLHRERQS